MTGGVGEIVTERFTLAFALIVNMPNDTTTNSMIPKTVSLNARPLPLSIWELKNIKLYVMKFTEESSIHFLARFSLSATYSSNEREALAFLEKRKCGRCLHSLRLALNSATARIINGNLLPTLGKSVQRLVLAEAFIPELVVVKERFYVTAHR
jgi:hypothetical protein